MKKLFFAVVAVFLMSSYALAQSYQEVVYLKNGSVIRGVVIEQVPGQSLKIQTGDGSIFAYSMADVEKITKEVPVKVANYSTGNATKETTSGLQRGYRCFVDIADTFGVGDFAADRAEITTAHGFQFNEHFFLGGGVGAHYYYDYDVVEIPVFVDFRVDFMNTRATPYVDIRAGYTFYEDMGVYLAPSVGARIRLGSWGALNVGVGYTAQFVEYDDYYYSGSENLGGVTLRVGLEF